jgi:hypothetical protein
LLLEGLLSNDYRLNKESDMNTIQPSAESGRLELARAAFRDFYAQCFWYLRRDMVVTSADVDEIARGLRQHGGRQGFLLAARLCR